MLPSVEGAMLWRVGRLMVALAEQRTFVIEGLGNVLLSPKIVIPNLEARRGTLRCEWMGSGVCRVRNDAGIQRFRSCQTTPRTQADVRSLNHMDEAPGGLMF